MPAPSEEGTTDQLMLPNDPSQVQVQVQVIGHGSITFVVLLWLVSINCTLFPVFFLAVVTMKVFGSGS